MIKKEIIPSVVVYRDCFNDINEVLKSIKKSENGPGSDKIKKWSPWAHFGLMSREVREFEQNNINLAENENKNSSEVEEQKLIDEIRRVYNLVSKEYMSEFKDKVQWPEYIKTFDMNSDIWSQGSIDFLKYNTSHPGQMHKYAMHYHTDNHEYEHSRANKWALTVTMYLNDDYEGGEISFFNKDEGKVVSYKPKAGDVTVFPSFSPYYHGVFKILSGEKYLIRMFWLYAYDGSKEWQDQEIKYGAGIWAKMEEERKKNFDSKESAKYNYYVVFDGDEIDSENHHSPFFAKGKLERFSNDW